MIKILFISNSTGIDYQCHCLFHGLNELQNVDVYTIYDQSFMYSDYPIEKRNQLYGMGFTISSRVEPSKRHLQSLNECIECLKIKYYDVVIYGQIHRCIDLWDEVVSNYPSNRVVCIDGEDWMVTYYTIKNLSKHLIKSLVGKCLGKEEYSDGIKKIYQNKALSLSCSRQATLFKREMSEKDIHLFKPIFFAIPKDCVVDKVPNKNRRLAHIIPGKKETYIYKTEHDYFKGYQDAIWGMTFKKNGWDCLRHYEILGNGCIPYFPGINKCPKSIMVPFPKQIISYTNMMYEEGIEGGWEVNYYLKQLLDYTREYLSTEALAKYVLQTVGI